jgi:NAD(P)-dependent dehydrogenase (short-subunit alcohol dehydrogenase family)
MSDGQGPLHGLVALVTGGAGHLGSAMTSSLAGLGASVVVADIDSGRAGGHAATITDAGFSALAVEMDVASEESVASAFATAIDRLGGIDILVNNASPSPLVARDRPAVELDLHVWDAIFAVTVRGALLCAQQAVPSMTGRGGGVVINIASIHALAGDTNLTAYSAAKAALIGFSRTLATQYGRVGIRSNSITLGTIPSPTLSQALRQSRVKHQLVPREGLAADVANMVGFLASPASSFLTGANFMCDGGILSHLPFYADGPATVQTRPGE